MAHAKLAQESDPLSSYANTVVGFTCLSAGKHAEALRACERAVGLDPESYLGRWCYHMALHLKGGSRKPWLPGKYPSPCPAATFGPWRHLPWPSQTGANLRIPRRYMRSWRPGRRLYVPPSQLAVAASAAGKEDEAIRHAHEAFEIRDPLTLMFSAYWPYSARLYAYLRFRELVAGTWLGVSRK